MGRPHTSLPNFPTWRGPTQISTGTENIPSHFATRPLVSKHLINSFPLWPFTWLSEALALPHKFVQLSNKVILKRTYLSHTPIQQHNKHWVLCRKKKKKLVITESHLIYQHNLVLEKAAYKIRYIFSSSSLCAQNAQSLVGRKTCAIEPSVQINKVTFRKGKSIISSKLKTAAAIKD